MTDVEKIVWGAFGGLTVVVMGQLLAKFFIEPLYELRKAVGGVRFNLAFHAPAILTPIGRSQEDSDKAREALMKSSCDLIADLHGIPAYGITRLLALGVLPSRKAIEDAAVQLRGLSTYVHETGEKANSSLDTIRKRIERIEKLLGLRSLE